MTTTKIRAYEVTLSPSGRSFMVEPGETLLEAALRDGMIVNYHCANGSCGDCRAQIIEGKVADKLPYDYVFKGEERLQPMILMCRTRPASNMVIEVKETNSVDDIPYQEVLTTVLRRTPLNDDIVELQLRTPRSQPLRFMAGQKVTLHVDGFTPINKSIASCPCDGRDLLFHFSRSDGNPLTAYIIDQLKIRDSIRLKGPFGEFVLPRTLRNRIVLIAYETGFAPIKSLIEHVFSLETTTPIELIWLAHDSAGHYLHNHCRAWKDVMTNFTYSLIETSCLISATDVPGCLNALLKPHITNIDGADIYIAAPQVVAETVASITGDCAAKDIILIHDQLIV